MVLASWLEDYGRLSLALGAYSADITIPNDFTLELESNIYKKVLLIGLPNRVMVEFIRPRLHIFYDPYFFLQLW